MEAVERLKSETGQEFELINVGKNWFELKPSSVDKIVAIGDLSSRLGVSEDQILSVGDQGQVGGNDEKFLNRKGGFSVGEGTNNVYPFVTRDIKEAEGTLWLLYNLNFKPAPSNIDLPAEAVGESIKNLGIVASSPDRQLSEGCDQCLVDFVQPIKQYVDKAKEAIRSEDIETAKKNIDAAKRLLNSHIRQNQVMQQTGEAIVETTEADLYRTEDQYIEASEAIREAIDEINIALQKDLSSNAKDGLVSLRSDLESLLNRVNGVLRQLDIDITILELSQKIDSLISEGEMPKLKVDKGRIAYTIGNTQVYIDRQSGRITAKFRDTSPEIEIPAHQARDILNSLSNNKQKGFLGFLSGDEIHGVPVDEWKKATRQLLINILSDSDTEEIRAAYSGLLTADQMSKLLSADRNSRFDILIEMGYLPIQLSEVYTHYYLDNVESFDVF